MLDRLVLVDEGRVARDDEQVAKARERGDDVLGQAIGEKLLLGLAAHVGERQDGDRRLLRDRAQWGLQACGRGGDRRGGSLLLVQAHAEHPNRPRQILDALLAQILKHHAEPVPGLIANRARDADAAGFGELLQARGHVHAIAEDVVVLADHVAEVEADAKADLAPRRRVAVAPRHTPLDLDRARHRIRDARELDQHAIPGGLDQPAPVVGDRRIDQLQTMGLETRERARLIGFHQAAVADHVGRKDGREPAFDCGLVHERNLAADQGDDKPPLTRPGAPSLRVRFASTTRGASRHDALPGGVVLVPPAGLEPARPCGQQILSSKRRIFLTN